jgi:hypothetical protein
MNRLTVALELCTPSGDRRAFPFPAHYEVCGRCRGEGKHVNPSIDGNGLDPHDPELDEDFWDGYFAGRYNVACHVCGGDRVVPVVDVDQLRGIKLARWKLYQRQREESDEVDRMYAAERAMGA